MKNSIIFILFFNVCCLSVLMVLRFFHYYSTEIFSYLLWFYIEGLSLGLFLYPIVQLFAKRFSIGLILKFIIDGLICLLIINLLSFWADRDFLTLELFGTKERSAVNENNKLIHIITLLSLIITSIIIELHRRRLERKDRAQ